MFSRSRDARGPTRHPLRPLPRLLILLSSRPTSDPTSYSPAREFRPRCSPTKSLGPMDGRKRSRTPATSMDDNGRRVRVQLALADRHRGRFSFSFHRRERERETPVFFLSSSLLSDVPSALTYLRISGPHRSFFCLLSSFCFFFLSVDSPPLRHLLLFSLRDTVFFGVHTRVSDIFADIRPSVC